MWIAFDKEHLPPDGSYIARRWVPSRVDNPQYGKLTILNGACCSHDTDTITHYAIDPGLLAGPAQIVITAWLCNHCNNINMVQTLYGSAQSLRCNYCGAEITISQINGNKDNNIP